MDLRLLVPMLTTIPPAGIRYKTHFTVLRSLRRVR